MSGYLQHVLNRAQGLAPVLRPRPRSPFEPLTGPAGGGPFGIEAGTAHLTAEATGEPGPGLRHPSPEHALRAPGLPVTASASAGLTSAGLTSAELTSAGPRPVDGAGPSTMSRSPIPGAGDLTADPDTAPAAGATPVPAAIATPVPAWTSTARAVPAAATPSAPVGGPSRDAAAPALSALALSGPALSGPALSGPALSGPALSGPALSGKALSGPAPASLEAGGGPSSGPSSGPVTHRTAAVAVTGVRAGAAPPLEDGGPGAGTALGRAPGTASAAPDRPAGRTAAAPRAAAPPAPDRSPRGPTGPQPSMHPVLQALSPGAHPDPRPARPGPRARSRPADAPPVVNVTIGRVEVRAPAPPFPAVEPAPPSAPAGPQPMSLAEYLERRDGHRS